jgi:hypothetical protein
MDELRELIDEWRGWNAPRHMSEDRANGAEMAREHCADELEAALAAIPVGGWRPIESAPKNGSWVLLLSQEGGVQCGYWGGTYFGFDPAWIQYAHRTECVRVTGEPTHWQPLPLPPPANHAGEANE